MTVVRPGLQLLDSLLGALHCGRPGPARAAALAAAAASPADAPIHYLDATYAALIAGEPRAAKRLLAQCAASAPDDPIWARRIAACQTWIWQRDLNVYPGEVAAEVVAGEAPPFPTPIPDEPETYLVEAIASYVNEILSAGVQIEHHVRGNNAVVPNFLQATWNAVQRLVSAVDAFRPQASSVNVFLFWADALRRAGQLDSALAVLAEIRKAHELSAADGVVNSTGLALTHMAEGDWFAAPGSTPEALGFDLATENTQSPFLGLRDLNRVAAAYDRATALLDGVDEPRAHAALALRRAALAGERGDRALQRTLIDEAGMLFSTAGDRGGGWLVAAHRLLSDLAAGRIAVTRRAAGMRFDLEPRGDIAALRAWAETDGSVSFGTGIGRLFQRAAQGWAAVGDHQRATVAYEMAIPLIALSGAEADGVLLLDLAGSEASSGLIRRALTRAQTAATRLAPVKNAADEPLEWMRRTSAFIALSVQQTTASATAAGTDVGALDWALARSRELMAIPGVPAAGASQGLDVAALLARDAKRSFDELQAAATDPPLATANGPLATFADAVRDMLAFSDAFASVERGRAAAALGASVPAERWYRDALEKARALRAEYAPLEVMVWVARDRLVEARQRLREIDEPSVPRWMLTTAAVRARDYRRALELFGDDRPQAWPEIADRAEVTLGVGDVGAAVGWARLAVQTFEESLAQIRRDVERAGVGDDIKVASLYLTAARALLAQAEGLSADDAADAARAEAFGYADRARVIALSSLASREGEDLFLSWTRTLSEWQAAQDRLYRAYVANAVATEIAEQTAALTAIEEELVEVEAEIESDQRPPHPPRQAPGLADVQRALPPDAVLLEYQIVGRDLLIWAITRSTVDTAAQVVNSSEVARLTRAFHRACANSSPSGEASELGAYLLEPVASVVDGCRRVIVVPYGPLNALPFHVLPYDGQALGTTHVVSYLPSAALIAAAIVDAPFASSDALVVGDPAFDPLTHPELRRLPGAAVEARAIAARHKVEPLLATEATELRIRARMGTANIVHFAAHGRLDAVAPTASSIVLAGRDELTVSDLVGMRIDAELAIFSACDSGRGAVSLGGDVVGLVRGLVAAGAKRSIVSLWPVDDAPAAVTMAAFHERVAGGVSTAEALHEVQALIRGLSSDQIALHYRDLGGSADPGLTRRRAAPAPRHEPIGIPWDPEFADTLDDGAPLETLDGKQARIWAPFIVVGV